MGILTVAKFDHSYSNSPAVFKEFNNFKELSNHCPIAIEVERCGIQHQSVGDLCNHRRKIQRCKIVRLPGLSRILISNSTLILYLLSYEVDTNTGIEYCRERVR